MPILHNPWCSFSITFKKQNNIFPHILIDSIQIRRYTFWPQTTNQSDCCPLKLMMFTPHKSEKAWESKIISIVVLPRILKAQRQQTTDEKHICLSNLDDVEFLRKCTYLSLKIRSSCCNCVTASKDRSGSHLSGVFGGGFFEARAAKLELIPTANRSKQFKCRIYYHLFIH